MSAAKEKRIDISDIKKLGIIAGGGAMPAILLNACRARGIEPFVIAFKGQTDTSLVDGVDHIWTRLGGAGEAFKALEEKGIHDLVMIGKIRRPSLRELRPDATAAKFFAQIGLKALGDDGILSAIRNFLEERGFQIHGAHVFAADELLMPEGVLGAHSPTQDDQIDIDRGVDVLTQMSELDVGQAVIVQEGLVLGIEAAEGTDGLIMRCKDLKREGRGGVLVKLIKQGQDKDLDMPTAGLKTIENAAKIGLSGIALHADNSLLLDQDAVVRCADSHKMFVIGLKP